MPSDQPDEVRPRPLIHLAHGVMMGIADSIPGISGGTIALVVGIYDDLLHSIGEGFRAILSLVRLQLTEAKQHLSEIRWALVLPLLTGIGTALVVAASIVPELLDRFPSQSRSLFLGMVAASLAIPWSRIGRRGSRLFMAMGIATVVAFVLSGLPPGTVAQPSSLQIFAAAAVAICAMILPGVSGAFLLVVLGMYEPTLEAVHDRDLVYVATFGVGAVLGLGPFSLLLTAALRRFHDTTMALLVGLMLGSLRALWPWQTETRGLLAPDGAGSIALAMGVATAGFATVLVIERWSSRRAQLIVS